MGPEQAAERASGSDRRFVGVFGRLDTGSHYGSWHHGPATPPVVGGWAAVPDNDYGRSLYSRRSLFLEKPPFFNGLLTHRSQSSGTKADIPHYPLSRVPEGGYKTDRVQ